MKVTNAILTDLVHCSYKVFNGLKRNSVPDEPEISTLFKRLKESHFKRVVEAKTMASISFNVTLENEGFCLNFDGIEQKSKSNQITIMTVPFELAQGLVGLVLGSESRHCTCHRWKTRTPRWTATRFAIINTLFDVIILLTEGSKKRMTTLFNSDMGFL